VATRPESDVSAVLLTIGEPTAAAALDSIHAQTLAPRDLIVVRDETPFHRAFNRGAAGVATPFFVQVDADMRLDAHCFAALRRGVRRSSGVVVGQLRDELLGRVVGVKLIRTACFALSPFPNSVSPDTDFGAAIARRGWTTTHLDRLATLGEHRPSYSTEYTYRKYVLEGSRYRYRRRPEGLRWVVERLDDSTHPAAIAAQIGLAQGLAEERRDDGLMPTAASDEAQRLLRLESGGRATGSVPVLPPLSPGEDLYARFHEYGAAMAASGDWEAVRRGLEGIRRAPRSDASLLARFAFSRGLMAPDLPASGLQTEHRALREFLATSRPALSRLRRSLVGAFRRIRSGESVR
jgi:hypothetical protein